MRKSKAASFYTRLKEEQKDLETNLDKLRAFIDTPVFASLPERQQGLLITQANIMASYVCVLELRIKEIDNALDER